MVKILEPGQRDADKTYQTVCVGCRCMFEFQRKEARFVPDTRDGNAVVINCPTCSRECWVTA